MGRHFSWKKMVLVCTIVSLCYFSPANSQPQKELALEYPELSVVPRASERLRSEAAGENESRWHSQRLLLTSAALTMISGVVGNNSLPENPNPEQRATSQTMASTALFVGAAWVITGSWLANRYTPYQEGWSEVEKLPQGTQKEQLHRERLAEESLAAPAGLGKKIVIMSAVSNFLVNAAVLSSSGDSGRQVGAIGALAAFAPVIFPYHWQVVNDQHQLYKKKIYGPVVSSTVITAPEGQLLPALAVNWNY